MEQGYMLLLYNAIYLQGFVIIYGDVTKSFVCVYN